MTCIRKLPLNEFDYGLRNNKINLTCKLDDVPHTVLWGTIPKETFSILVLVLHFSYFQGCIVIVVSSWSEYKLRR